MERDLDKAIEDKVAECITKSISQDKFIKRISSGFDSVLNKLNKSIDKLNNKICKEENAM